MPGCWRFPLLCDIIIRSESKSYRSIIIILRRLLRGNTREAMAALFRASCSGICWALPRAHENSARGHKDSPCPPPVTEAEAAELLQPSRAEGKGIRRWKATKRSSAPAHVSRSIHHHPWDAAGSPRPHGPGVAPERPRSEAGTSRCSGVKERGVISVLNGEKPSGLVVFVLWVNRLLWLTNGSFRRLKHSRARSSIICLVLSAKEDASRATSL